MTGQLRLNPPGAALGGFNAVMTALYCPADVGHRIYRQAVDFEGPLSLKIVLRGQGRWRTEKGCYVVDQGYCLPLNRGEVYSLTFDLAEPVETFCPFFAHDFAEDVVRGMTDWHEAMLDDPQFRGDPLRLAPHVRPLDPALAGPLARLQQLSRDAGPCPLAWDDCFAGLAEALVRLAPGWRAEHANRSRRPSTRAEVTRRLNRARDFIHAEAHHSLTLAEIAAAASLSPHHFHRLFRAAFHATPCAYVAELRLARAARRLLGTDASVTDICLAVGWESLGSFSSRFHRRFGASPASWRKIARLEKPTFRSLA